MARDSPVAWSYCSIIFGILSPFLVFFFNTKRGTALAFQSRQDLSTPNYF